MLPHLGLERRAGTDFRIHTPRVNRLLVETYRLESRALRRGGRLPAGLSVTALAGLLKSGCPSC